MNDDTQVDIMNPQMEIVFFFFYHHVTELGGQFTFMNNK